MTMNPREKDIRSKKVEDEHNYNQMFPRITPSSSSSRQWSNHKNPRIVRVSRAFGGKDRHSKVCTVRGLRDRRIRLSVPTAIQLYDLQDRLGLSQPSKVVDWLIDATKDDIDKLPPLPMLPGSYSQLLHQPTLASFDIESSVPQSSLSHFLTSSNHPYAKDLGLINPTKEGIKMNDQEDQEDFGGLVSQLSAQNLFPLSNNNQSCFPNNPYFHLDPPSLSLSQFGGGYPFSSQTEDHHQPHVHNNNLSTMNLASTSQLYYCPSATTIPSLIPTFPSYINPSMENEWRQINHLQQNPNFPTTLQLISSPMKPFALNVNSKPEDLQGNHTERDDKHKEILQDNKFSCIE